MSNSDKLPQRIIFTGGGAKGGCGKTSLALALIEWYDKNENPPKKRSPAKRGQGGKQ